jgi:hypothetical protein
MMSLTEYAGNKGDVLIASSSTQALEWRDRIIGNIKGSDDELRVLVLTDEYRVLINPRNRVRKPKQPVLVGGLSES